MQQFSTASYSQLLGAGLIFASVVLAVYLMRRRIEDRRAKKKLAEAIRLELNVPTSLHPVIDADVCIGSGSCISACPEGKILGLVDGVATLLNASKCIGHGKCAVECPVDAIRLVFGTAERGVDLPEVDEFFETSRAGRAHRRRAGRHGPDQERADPGPAGRRSLQRDHRPRAVPGRARGRRRRRDRGRRAGRHRHRGRLPRRRPLLRADGAGHRRRHGGALPAPEAGDDRDDRPALLRQVRPDADPQGEPGRVVRGGDREGRAQDPREDQADRLWPASATTSPSPPTRG